MNTTCISGRRTNIRRATSEPSNVRHHHVRQQQIDSARVVFGERDRVTAVFGFQHRIAESLEELANHPA